MKKGNNRFHGQLQLIGKVLGPFAQQNMNKIEPKLEHKSSIPAYKFRDKEREARIFDGLCFIDMLLEMINVTIISNLTGTKFNSFEADMQLSNLKAILEDLRKHWLGGRIALHPEFRDHMLNEHSAQLATLFFNLAFKPTEFIEGLNEMFNEQIIKTS